MHTFILHANRKWLEWLWLERYKILELNLNICSCKRLQWKFNHALPRRGCVCGWRLLTGQHLYRPCGDFFSKRKVQLHVGAFAKKRIWPRHLSLQRQYHCLWWIPQSGCKFYFTNIRGTCQSKKVITSKCVFPYLCISSRSKSFIFKAQIGL